MKIKLATTEGIGLGSMRSEMAGLGLCEGIKGNKLKVKMLGNKILS